CLSASLPIMVNSHLFSLKDSAPSHIYTLSLHDALPIFLYRRISDTIGVYHIELVLPDVMRQLEFGEVSVTLPVIVVDIYTNGDLDRKSTRLNSSHVAISYAVFCLKKKNTHQMG